MFHTLEIRWEPCQFTPPPPTELEKNVLKIAQKGQNAEEYSLHCFLFWDSQLLTTTRQESC